MNFHFSTVRRVGYRETLNSLKILQAAKQVFIRDGSEKFSARGVAKEAGLSLGAVQHFFPTKRDLLAAMLEYVVNAYEIAYQRLCDRLPMNGETRLLGVLDILIADIWKRDTRKFFFGFWALACHNSAAGELFSEMYSFHVKRIGTFLGAARPGLSEKRCEELAIQIAAMIEGLMLFSAPRGKRFTTRERMSHMVKETILRLLRENEHVSSIAANQ
jgi:AcrR family transcriptional regulator